MFRTEFYRLLRRWQLAIGMIALVGFMLQGFYSYYTKPPYFSGQYSAYMSYISALGTGSGAFWIVVLPLISCLVAGDSLAWDRRTGAIRFMLIRLSRKQYILGKILSSSMFTILFVSIGLILSFVIASILFPLKLPPWRFVNGTATFSVPGVPKSEIFLFPTFMHNFFFEHPFTYILLVTGIVVLSAVVWTNIALLASLFTTNIYLVMGIPWLIYIIVSFIMMIPLVGLPHYSPLVLSGPFMESGPGTGPSALSIPIFWMVVILLINTLSYIIFLRKGGEVLD
ncbi:hypothetical protein [Geobacillus thermocatenulatus]|uniref:hypothetical protein n=1 Tax=Geobacillus thermocatenulatus TaxID=33938 RepID=UPI0006CD4254|nr:hypothetical protein [Geobacillus thermocatenulatus]KPC97287.1 ABC-2 family transporter protein [Geobacillus sp. BCO2]